MSAKISHMEKIGKTLRKQHKVHILMGLKYVN